jgi:hypothetical protein
MKAQHARQPAASKFCRRANEGIEGCGQNESGEAAAQDSDLGSFSKLS